jgi:hypothetical protein
MKHVNPDVTEQRLVHELARPRRFEFIEQLFGLTGASGSRSSRIASVKATPSCTAR